MNDPQVRLLVKVLQASCDADDYLVPGFPVQKRCTITPCKVNNSLFFSSSPVDMLRSILLTK
jgi:hypothetical protein